MRNERGVPTTNHNGSAAMKHLEWDRLGFSTRNWIGAFCRSGLAAGVLAPLLLAAPGLAQEPNSPEVQEEGEVASDEAYGRSKLRSMTRPAACWRKFWLPPNGGRPCCRKRRWPSPPSARTPSRKSASSTSRTSAPWRQHRLQQAAVVQLQHLHRHSRRGQRRNILDG